MTAPDLPMRERLAEISEKLAAFEAAVDAIQATLNMRPEQRRAVELALRRVNKPYYPPRRPLLHNGRKGRG